VCFGTRGIILFKTRNVEVVQDSDSVFVEGGKDRAAGEWKKGYIYSSSYNV